MNTNQSYISSIKTCSNCKIKNYCNEIVINSKKKKNSHRKEISFLLEYWFTCSLKQFIHIFFVVDKMYDFTDKLKT